VDQFVSGSAWNSFGAPCPPNVPSDFHKPDELLSFDQSVAAMEV
jgi:hypothetical protein